jgi:hypothetical protein
MKRRFTSLAHATAFAATDVWCRLTAVSVVVIAALGSSCIQPNLELDDFGTNGQSSVTGDDAGPALESGNTGGDSDQAESGDDSRAEPEDDVEDDGVDTTPVPGASKLPDAGLKVVDAGKPRADATTSPAVDAGGGPADGSTPAPTGSALTKLSFSVTTATLRGRYSPRNIYAIWVADAQGKFVKTLAKFAFIRARYLTGWNAASGGNVVDAVTGATVSDHGTRSVTWNLTDVSKKPVPDGDYKIVVELTDADKTGASTSVPFTKGPAPVKLMPPDQANFLKMSLVLE